MNKSIKRIFAAVQVFVCIIALCLSTYAAPSTNLVNDGIRHTTCVSLSDAAEAYYEDYEYDTLSEQSASALLKSLRALMTKTHGYRSTYNDCRDLAAKVDSNGTDGKISLLYSSVTVTRSNFGSGGNVWNREHVWPQSLGGFGTTGAGADLHHIRPADATLNTIRNNRKYGNVTGGTKATGSGLVGGMVGGKYSGSYFEPLDNAKGDVARICLYVYVRYGGDISQCSSITTVFQSVDVLLEWCELDPVDEWEMSRNDVVEDIQGNRNVFIDYPEYAWQIFNREVPSDMVTPSGEAMNNTASGTTPGTTPDTTPDTTPGTTPDTTPDTTPGTTPDITPDTTPSDIPDTVPDTTVPESDDGCAHEFDAWEEVGNDEMMRICAICGNIDIRNKYELGDDCPHSFDEWLDVGEGEQMGVCEWCGKVELAEKQPEQETDTTVSDGGCAGANGVIIFAPFIALLCTAGLFINKKK